ncbi:MAG: [amino group carrier protein]-L-2-aminoadipate 6-kinase [Bacillota bacterium]|nr:[amino group carrier protein]-L-2-aminoadipate 6-kinase [Bacillota bacterium]
MLVVKLGGAAGIEPGALVKDLADCLKGAAAGPAGRTAREVVLVHGGSAAADELALALGRPPRHYMSPSGVKSRYTDRAALEVLLMACAGRLNKLLVEALQKEGVNALGLSGLDGRLITGLRKKAVKAVVDGRTVVLRDDYSGRLEAVNAPLLRLLLSAGCTPVISSLALSEAGEALNLDADRVAAGVACALGAEALVFLSNVPGLLRDPADARSLISRIPAAKLASFQGVAQGRMKKKLLAAAEAVAGGVERVIIADARRARPLTLALAGEGTVIAA